MGRNAPEGSGVVTPKPAAVVPRTDVSVTIAPAKPKAVSTTSTKAAPKSASKAAPKAAAPAAKPVDWNEAALQYGMTAGMISAYPELKALVEQAVREGWTSDKFQAKFRNSNWYKSMSDSQRKAAIMQYTDPASWGQLWNQTQSHIMDLLGQMGANPGDWNVINAIAGKVIWEGWNDDRARQEIGQHIVFGPNNMAGGKAGEIQSDLNSYAYSMGVKNADWWIQNAVRGVLTGKNSIQDFKNDIMNQSIAAFPGFMDQFKAGASLADIAQPYTQSMSQILEIANGDINLFDPTIRNALSWKDGTGKSASKPLWQFQNELRTDPRWGKTQNAQDASMGVAHKVLQDFGIYS